MKKLFIALISISFQGVCFAGDSDMARRYNNVGYYQNYCYNLTNMGQKINNDKVDNYSKDLAIAIADANLEANSDVGFPSHIRDDIYYIIDKVYDGKDRSVSKLKQEILNYCKSKYLK
ncbi:hypothetical protein ACPC5U_13385 [Acinetobacter haemolyticus]|uniref:hypothetical protein n=1 Tax=Acinetobacter haemolyticus TaxID=29430 RepID=UPI003C18364E